MQRKPFQKMLFKNAFFSTLPVIFLAGFSLLVSFFVAVYSGMRIYRVNQDADPELLLAGQEENLRISVLTNLSAAGFETRGSRKNILYYQRRDDGTIRLFLLRDETAEKIQKGSVKNVFLKLEKDETTASYVEKNYQDLLGKNISLDGFTEPYLYSEPDFPRAGFAALFLWQVAGAAVFCGAFLYLILCTLSPVCNRQTAFLKATGDRRQGIRHIDDDLSRHLLCRRGSVFVTENYLIVNFVSGIEVTALADVRHVTRTRTTRKKRTYYRMAVSNEDKMYREYFFYHKEDMDKVAEEIENVIQGK